MKPNKGVAWYDVNGSGPIRDLLVILHPPYTLWHLSYVAIGAALAPAMNWSLLGLTVLAFFLAMGLGGHCLDELNGRPLRTTRPDYSLILVASGSIALATWIGVQVGMSETLWVIPCIIFGAFIVVAYNLEWGNGFFHQDYWFGIAWGSFPVITAFVAQAHTISWAAVLLAIFAFCSSMGQRKLSLWVRYWRRKVLRLDAVYWEDRKAFEIPGGPKVFSTVGMGEYAYTLTQKEIIRAADLALKYMNAAVVVAAVGLLLYRWLG